MINCHANYYQWSMHLFFDMAFWYGLVGPLPLLKAQIGSIKFRVNWPSCVIECWKVKVNNFEDQFMVYVSPTFNHVCQILMSHHSNSTWLFMRINLQLQTSDFVDVDLALWTLLWLQQIPKNPLTVQSYIWPPPEGGQACRIGPLEQPSTSPRVLKIYIYKVRGLQL